MAFASGLIVACGSPEYARFRVARRVERLFGRLFAASVMSCYRKERRAGAISFDGILTAVMSRIRFDRVTMVVDVDSTANGSLLTLQGQLGRVLEDIAIMLILVMRRRSKCVIRHVRHAVVVGRYLGVRSAIAAQFVQNLRCDALFEAGSVRHMIQRVIDVVICCLGLVMANQAVNIDAAPIFRQRRDFYEGTFNGRVGFLLGFRINRGYAFGL